jgi:hypothetical protein
MDFKNIRQLKLFLYPWKLMQDIEDYKGAKLLENLGKHHIYNKQ